MAFSDFSWLEMQHARTAGFVISAYRADIHPLNNHVSWEEGFLLVTQPIERMTLELEDRTCHPEIEMTKCT